MTIKLYDKDPYIQYFKAKVTSITGNFVELDQTAFYAEAGGQSGDSGTLNGEKVTYSKWSNRLGEKIQNNETAQRQSYNGVFFMGKLRVHGKAGQFCR